VKSSYNAPKKQGIKRPILAEYQQQDGQNAAKAAQLHLQVVLRVPLPNPHQMRVFYYHQGQNRPTPNAFKPDSLRPFEQTRGQNDNDCVGQPNGQTRPPPGCSDRIRGLFND
jgi:hypothetical protein